MPPDRAQPGALLSSAGPGPHRDGSPTLDDPHIPPPADAPGDPAPAAPAGDPPGDPPGLRDQLGSTTGAGRRLVDAHIELAKAEFSEIGDQIKRIAVFAGIAVATILSAGLLLAIGLPLFLGEAIFGSIGWGLLHGVLFLIGLGLAAGLAAAGYGARPILGTFLIAALIAIGVGVVLGLDLTNRGWTLLGDAVLPGVEAGVRPLATAAAVLATIGAALGLLGGLRAGGGARGAIGWAVAGGVLGALLGVLTAIALGPRVGAAVGVTVGLIAWPAMMGAAVARIGFDAEALKKKLVPERTIATTKETIEWARERMPLMRRS